MRAMKSSECRWQVRASICSLLPKRDTERERESLNSSCSFAVVRDDIPIIGRNTSGVKLMSIDADSNVRVASIAKVRESSRQDEENEDVEAPENPEDEEKETTEK